MRVTIRGRRYEITRPRLKAARGDCDHPATPSKRIRIRRDLSGEIELDTLIHELLHACCFDLAEDVVNESATDIAAVLWKWGYRKGT